MYLYVLVKDNIYQAVKAMMHSYPFVLPWECYMIKQWYVHWYTLPWTLRSVGIYML